MAAGFEYFKHDDVGAPTLSGTVGSFIALLDWVLVSKGGWAKVYTGTNLAAYQSLTGNRHFLRIDDTQTTHARARAYRAMTAISTGTNQYPTTTQATTLNTWGTVKSYDASATARPYWGIRTNRYVIIVTQTTSISEVGVGYRQLFGFGDMPSLVASDSHNTVILGIPGSDTNYFMTINEVSNAGSVTPSSNYPTASVYAAISGTPSGSVLSPLCQMQAPYKNGGSSSYLDSLALSNTMFFTPMVLGSTNSASSSSAGVIPRLKISNLSMLYGGASDVVLTNSPVQDLVPIVVGSRTFLPIVATIDGSHTANECYLLETTDTDGAL